MERATLVRNAGRCAQLINDATIAWSWDHQTPTSLLSPFSLPRFRVLQGELLLSVFGGERGREKGRAAMEEEGGSVYRGLRSFWMKKGYVRLNGSGRRKSRVELARLGSVRRRRFWRIKPKLRRFRVPSPKKFFIWLRDAYVKMMLGLANSRVVSSSGYCGALGDVGIGGFGQRPLKEYDEKMIIEIYKSLVMAEGLVPRDVTTIGSVVDFRR